VPCSGHAHTAYSINGTVRYYGNGVPVLGVVVELKGATTLSAETDANGQFAFDAVSGLAQRDPP
jgi:phosphatidate phosphatase APP1